MSDNWSDDRDDDEEELPRPARRSGSQSRPARQVIRPAAVDSDEEERAWSPPRAAAPRAARTAPATRPSATTVAARRAAARPPQRDTFPMAVSAVVVVLLLGILGVLVLNRSDSTGTAGVSPATAIIGTAAPAVAAVTAAPDAQAVVPRMALADFKALYDDPAKRPLIIDVRAKENYDQGHITGAINIPESDLDARVKEVPKDKLVIAYCQ